MALPLQFPLIAHSFRVLRIIQLSLRRASVLLLTNIGLQILDGALTYCGIQLGFKEGNPLIQATMIFWGVGWGLVIWKGLACVLLVLVYCVRESINIVLGLTFTACFYLVLSVCSWLAVLLSHALHHTGFAF